MGHPTRSGAGVRDGPLFEDSPPLRDISFLGAFWRPFFLNR